MSRIALDSFDPSTMSWISTCPGGPQNTPAQPWIRRRTAACHICKLSVRMSTAHATEQNMNSAIPICTRRRGSTRSASAPERVEKNRKGSQCDKTAKPPSAGE